MYPDILPYRAYNASLNSAMAHGYILLLFVSCILVVQSRVLHPGYYIIFLYPGSHVAAYLSKTSQWTSYARRAHT